MKRLSMAARAVPRLHSALSASARPTSLSAAAASSLRTAQRQRGNVRFASGGASSDLKKTPLYDFHVANGGKLVPFAGYHLPVQYSDLSLAQSHHFTRNHASLFDVSHMVQHIISGPKAAAFLETLTPSDWTNQPIMQGKLTTFLWPETGGIVDDSIITRLGENEYYVVTNGACLEKDTKYLAEELAKFGDGVEWNRLDNSGLVALQGPQSAEVLSEIVTGDLNLNELYFGSSVWANLDLGDGKVSSPVLISRGGYTGEDGFELSFSSNKGPAETTTPAVVGALLKKAGPERLQLAGLGARDSLRLEAGMCLYGHDLDDTTTPIEAALAWIIPQSRRKTGGFHGADVILGQLTPKSKGGAGVSRRRIGLVVAGAPAREGAEIHKDGEKIGIVTSGVPSPTLGKNIAMGYIKDGLHKAGTEVDVMVRGKKRKGTVTKMPFVPSKYWKAPA